MSDIFNAEVTASNPDENNEGAETKGYLDRLVETKGEQWKDPEVIAKGKIEADNHISTLMQELEQAREELQKQGYAKDLLEKLQTKGADPTPAEPNKSGTEASHTTTDPSEVENLVESLLAKREKERAFERNMEEATARLREAYGDQATLRINERAQQLGLSVDRMKELASESPKMFMELMGQAPKASTSNNPVTHGTLNTTGNPASQEKGWSYYQKLRKENVSLYRTPKVQNEMAALAQSDPDFFNK